jgi:hypothetical protein
MADCLYHRATVALTFIAMIASNRQDLWMKIL